MTNRVAAAMKQWNSTVGVALFALPVAAATWLSCAVFLRYGAAPWFAGMAAVVIAALVVAPREAYRPSLLAAGIVFALAYAAQLAYGIWLDLFPSAHGGSAPVSVFGALVLVGWLPSVFVAVHALVAMLLARRQGAPTIPLALLPVAVGLWGGHLLMHRYENTYIRLQTEARSLAPGQLAQWIDAQLRPGLLRGLVTRPSDPATLIETLEHVPASWLPRSGMPADSDTRALDALLHSAGPGSSGTSGPLYPLWLRGALSRDSFANLVEKRSAEREELFRAYGQVWQARPPTPAEEARLDAVARQLIAAGRGDDAVRVLLGASPHPVARRATLLPLCAAAANARAHVDCVVGLLDHRGYPVATEWPRWRAIADAWTAAVRELEPLIAQLASEQEREKAAVMLAHQRFFASLLSLRPDAIGPALAAAQTLEQVDEPQGLPSADHVRDYYRFLLFDLLLNEGLGNYLLADDCLSASDAASLRAAASSADVDGGTHVDQRQWRRRQREKMLLWIDAHAPAH